MFRVRSKHLNSHEHDDPGWEDETPCFEVVGTKPYFIAEVERRGPHERIWRFLLDNVSNLFSKVHHGDLRLSSVDMVLPLSNGYKIRRIKQVWQNTNDGSQLYIFDDGTMCGDDQMQTNFVYTGLTLLKELPEVFADNA